MDMALESRSLSSGSASQLPSNGCPGRNRSQKAPVAWTGTVTSTPSGSLSPKVFAAPVPWPQADRAILGALADFESRRVQWPRGAAGDNGGGDGGRRSKSSFCYVIFRSGRDVSRLLASCQGGRYCGLEIVPWYTDNATYQVPDAGARDPKRTVFVGGLHGMATASLLATAFGDLFGQVTHACLDTDRHMYPTGSAQVTFASRQVYLLAVGCHFVQLRTNKFSKRVQIEPFLEVSPCIVCHNFGPLFCRETTCLAYFCRNCWSVWHSTLELTHHNYIAYTRN